MPSWDQQQQVNYTVPEADTSDEMKFPAPAMFVQLIISYTAALCCKQHHAVVQGRAWNTGYRNEQSLVPYTLYLP